MLKKIILTAAVVLTCASSLAFAASPAMTGKTDKGQVLTDHKGMTLYTFKKDSDGKSACNGDCAKAWPPLMAGADAKTDGKYTVVTRDDGSKQWAYNGMPLYTWTKDMKAGDTTGNGFKDMWKVATP